METSTSEMEEKLRLTSLPPEVTEHIISMLPSLSLHNLPPLTRDLASMASREMRLRHEKMEMQGMMILTDSQTPPTNMLNNVSMLCPGLVMLYNSLSRNKTAADDESGDRNNNNKRKCPFTGKHTIELNMQKQLFTSTNDR